jgi:hypothetical protein
MILGIMAAVIVPNMWRIAPNYQRAQFTTTLNQLSALAWQNALRTHLLHRVFFDIEKKIVQVEVEIPESVQGKQQKKQFKLVDTTYRKPQYRWPEGLEIQQFFIDGVNQFKSGTRIETLWYYVLPEGLAQEVIINILDKAGAQPPEMSLVLNPFTAQFKEYDAYQKP